MMTLMLASTLLAVPAVTLRVSSPQAPATAAPAAFRATEILDVELGAVFRQRLAGEHVLDLKVYTPKGKLYQVLTVPFTGGAAPRGRRLAGYARPVREHSMKTRGPARYEVSARLPVAGTWIVTNSLYGTWRVDAHLDGRTSPAASQTFSIAP